MLTTLNLLVRSLLLLSPSSLPPTLFPSCVSFIPFTNKLHLIARSHLFLIHMLQKGFLVYVELFFELTVRVSFLTLIITSTSKLSSFISLMAPLLYALRPLLSLNISFPATLTPPSPFVLFCKLSLLDGRFLSHPLSYLQILAPFPLLWITQLPMTKRGTRRKRKYLGNGKKAGFWHTNLYFASS